MESASLLGILSSWEVIVACLLLMLLLPLVFAVASARSPIRRPPVSGRVRKAPVAAAPTAGAGEPADSDDEQDLPPRARTRQRPAERAAGPDEEA